MKSKDDIEAHAYGIWRTITSPQCDPFTILIAQPILEYLLWILECDTAETLHLDAGLLLAKQGMEQDSVINPLDVILKDRASRKDAQRKSRNSENN
jgi:hypothetical protein